MNLGSVGTTQKQKPSLHSGRLWGLQGQKGTPSVVQGESDVGSFLRSFTMNKHQMVKLLTKSIMLKFSVSCVMWCGAKYLCRGSKVTGSCTMKMPQPTHPTLSRTSWLNIRSHKCCSPCIHQTWPCVTFSIPKGENAVEGE